MIIKFDSSFKTNKLKLKRRSLAIQNLIKISTLPQLRNILKVAKLACRTGYLLAIMSLNLPRNNNKISVNVASNKIMS